MAEFEIARERNDIVLKYLMEALRGDFLHRFGLDLPPIVAALPTDLPLLEARSRRADYVFSLEDGSVLHLEFQTAREEEDLTRFAGYNHALYQRHKALVWTVVFWGSEVRSVPDEHLMGSLTLRLRNVLLGDENGTDLLDKLGAKVRRGEALDDDDRTGLALLPLMSQRRPLADQEVLATLKMVTETLPQDERAMLVGALAVLGWRFVDENWARTLLEGLKMTTTTLDTMIDEAIQRGLDEGRAEGKAEGEIEGYREALRRVLRTRFGDVPAGLAQRIASADRVEVDALLTHAITADSINTL